MATGVLTGAFETAGAGSAGAGARGGEVGFATLRAGGVAGVGLGSGVDGDADGWDGVFVRGMAGVVWATPVAGG